VESTAACGAYGRKKKGNKTQEIKKAAARGPRKLATKPERKRKAAARGPKKNFFFLP
jgi:hypothetical protein